MRKKRQRAKTGQSNNKKMKLNHCKEYITSKPKEGKRKQGDKYLNEDHRDIILGFVMLINDVNI